MSRFIAVLLFLLTTGSIIPTPARAAPEMQIGVMDDAACLFNRVASPQDLISRAKDLRANWLRINVYYKRVQNSWRRYDECVRVAVESGIEPHLTISCNGRGWESVKDYLHFARSVVRRYGAWVRSFSVCNEPNYPGWLRPNEGLSRAETYRLLYRVVANEFAGRIRLKWGELSGSHDPIGFMREALRLDRGGRVETTVADCIAYHPYQLENPGRDVSTDTKVGIGGIWRVEEVIDEAFKKGLLVTPSGDKPPLCLTEFGYQSRPRGDLADRELSDGARGEFLPKFAELACKNDRVVEVLFYQIFPSPLDWPGEWDTSLIDHDGTTDVAYRAIRKWAKDHPECVAPTSGLPI